MYKTPYWFNCVKPLVLGVTLLIAIPKVSANPLQNRLSIEINPLTIAPITGVYSSPAPSSMIYGSPIASPVPINPVNGLSERQLLGNYYPNISPFPVRRQIVDSTLISPTIINSSISNSVLVNPVIINSPGYSRRTWRSPVIYPSRRYIQFQIGY